MHMETYPNFFTPRDEEPSLSSSKEKSSEFDWLESKRTRKQKYQGKTEQVLYKNILLHLVGLHVIYLIYLIYDILYVKEITNNI